MALYDASLAWQQPVRASETARLQGRILHVVLFLTVLTSFVAFIEPAPYEAMMALLLLAAVIAGAAFDRKILPLVILLIIWNAGLLLALIPVTHDQKAVTYTIVSLYLATNAVIFACLVTTHCEQRLATIRAAYILAAFIASVLGIVGYFQIAAPDLRPVRAGGRGFESRRPRQFKALMRRHLAAFSFVRDFWRLPDAEQMIDEVDAARRAR